MAKKKQAPKNSYLMWRRSLVGGAVFAVVYMVLAYIFVSLAIDSGSLWQYALAIACLGLGVHSITLAIKYRGNGHKR